MSRQSCFWDHLAAWFGVTCDDWDADFADDGYADLWGRAPLNEPLWRESLPAETAASPNITVIPVSPRRGKAQ